MFPSSLDGQLQENTILHLKSKIMLKNSNKLIIVICKDNNHRNDTNISVKVSSATRWAVDDPIGGHHQIYECYYKTDKCYSQCII